RNGTGRPPVFSAVGAGARIKAVVATVSRIAHVPWANTAFAGVWNRGWTRPSPWKNIRSRAIAKYARGPVRALPLSEMNVEHITSRELATPPGFPSSDRQ